MAFDDNVVIRLQVDATAFRKGMQDAGQTVSDLNAKVKESAGQFTNTKASAAELQTEVEKLKAEQLTFIANGETEKADALNEKIAELNTQIEATKETAAVPVEMNVQSDVASEKIALIQSQIESLKSERMDFLADGDLQKADELNTKIADLKTQIETLKAEASTPIVMGVDTSKAVEEIRQLQDARNNAAANGDWAGVAESNKSIGFMQAQLQSVNTHGLKEGQDEWAKYAKEAGIATQEATGGLNIAGIELGSFGSMVGKVAGLLGVAFGVGQIISFTKELVAAGQESLESTTRLTQALGGNEQAAKRLSAEASRLRNTLGVSDEQIKGLMAFQAAQGRTEAQIKKTIQAAYDFAAVTGKDVNTALMQMDMTFEGMPGRLAKFDERIGLLSQAELKNGEAVDILAAKYAGMAEAMATTGTNKLNILKERIGELGEALGTSIIESKLMAGAMNLISGAVDVLQPKEQTLTDILVDERIKVNALTKELMSANTPLERRTLIMDELKQIYPDILNGIDEENISTKLLTDNLRVYNSEMLKAIGLQFQKEKLSESTKGFYEAQTKLTKLEFEAREILEKIFTNKPVQAKIDLKLQTDTRPFAQVAEDIYNDSQLAVEGVEKNFAGPKFAGLIKTWGKDGATALAKEFPKLLKDFSGYVTDVTYATNNAMLGTLSMGGDPFKNISDAQTVVDKLQAGVEDDMAKMTAATEKFGNALGVMDEKRNTKAQVQDYKSLGDEITQLTTTVNNYAAWEAQLETLKKKSIKTTQDEVNIKELETRIAATSIENVKKQLSQKTALQTAIEKETKAISEQGTLWEDYAKKIESANKEYLGYLKLKGIEDPGTQAALKRLAQLEKEQEQYQRLTEFVKKYGIEKYNQVAALNKQFSQLSFSEDLKLQMNFDWSQTSSWESLAEQLRIRLDDFEKRFTKITIDDLGIQHEVLDIPVSLKPEYAQMTDTLLKTQTYVAQFNSEIKKAADNVVASDDEMYQQLKQRRALHLADIVKQNKIAAELLAAPVGDNPVPEKIPTIAYSPYQVKWTEKDEKDFELYSNKQEIKIRDTYKKLGLVVDTEVENQKPTSIWESWFGVSDPVVQEQMSKVTDESVKMLTTLVDQYVQAQRDIVDSLNQRITEQEHVVQVELELNKNGSANNLDVEKKKLALLKAERDKAQKDQDKAVRSQMALQSILQISNIITAATQLFASNAKYGVIGVVLAAASIAAMIATMVKVKGSAASATKMREGGSVLLKTGERHERGGVKLPGTGIEVERDESIHVVRREQADKYHSFISQIVRMANAGTLMHREIFTRSENVQKKTALYVHDIVEKTSLTNEQKNVFVNVVANIVTEKLKPIMERGVSMSEIHSITNQYLLHHAINNATQTQFKEIIHEIESTNERLSVFREFMGDNTTTRNGAIPDVVTPKTIDYLHSPIIVAPIAQESTRAIMSAPVISVPDVKTPILTDSVVEHVVKLSEQSEIREIRDLLQRSLEHSITTSNGQTIIKSGNTTRIVTHEN